MLGVGYVVLLKKIFCSVAKMAHWRTVDGYHGEIYLMLMEQVYQTTAKTYTKGGLCRLIES